MIPFIDLSNLRIGPVRLQPFGLLLVLGVIVGHTLLVRRIRSRHIADAWTAEYFAIITLSSALLGAYLEGALLSLIPRLFPQAASITQRLSLSSLGGVMGAILSGFLFARRKRLPLWPLADAGAYSFSFAWLFARMGCASVHDHLGPPSNSIFAVQFPSGPRLDMGLLEAMGMPFVIGLALWIDKKQWPSGAIFGAVACAYPLLRFPLDFLRDFKSDPRYLGLTSAQWQCFLLFMIGCLAISKVFIQMKASPNKNAESNP